ncbi:TPA: hypothetical protein ACGR4L_004295 [Serratia marcescens]|uniref:hypothetical protein n=1 Tax=Serratia marcescens TaxID=615 RepID=UPI0009511148|nr:hypothetical protein [Serratia marcescens]
MAGLAFGVNASITVAIVLLLVITMLNVCRSAWKKRTLMVRGKATRARIVTVTQHKKPVALGKHALQLQLMYSVRGEGYHVLKDVLVAACAVDEFKAGKEITLRYSEEDPKMIVSLGPVEKEGDIRLW